LVQYESALDPVVDPSELRRQRRDTGHRGIDVQPHVVAPTHLADSGVGSKAIDEVVPCVEQTKNGTSPAARSAFDHGVERVGPHGIDASSCHGADAVGADAGDAEALLDARVRLRGRIRNQAGGVTVVVHGTAGGPPARREDRHQCGLAGGALDHAAAVSLVERKRSGRPSKLLHPVEHQRLELGDRRRGHPAHALHPEPADSNSPSIDGKELLAGK
jgi:hypothetical protein